MDSETSESIIFNLKLLRNNFMIQAICSYCKGTGKQKCPLCKDNSESNCEECKGTGEIICKGCMGGGLIDTLAMA